MDFALCCTVNLTLQYQLFAFNDNGHFHVSFRGKFTTPHRIDTRKFLRNSKPRTYVYRQIRETGFVLRISNWFSLSRKFSSLTES
jgi:hypothetical protein